MTINYGHAQSITVSPSPQDYCHGAVVPSPFILSINNPNQTHIYEWSYIDNSGYSSSDIGSRHAFGTGTSATLPFFEPGTTVDVMEYDASHTYISSGEFYYGFYQAGFPIPIYYEPNNNCGTISIPVSYDSFLAGRQATWYKDGIHVTLSSPFYDPQPGTYRYKLTLACGDSMLSSPITVSAVHSPPVIQITGSATVCSGDTITLTGTPAGSTMYWRNNGVNIPGATVNTYRATTPGNYTFYSYSGSCGKTSSPVTLTFQSGAVISTSDSAICGGDSSLLSCNAASSYQWYKNGTAIGSANSASITVKSTGNYSVITTGLICNTSKPKTVTVYPKPAITISPVGSSTICAGSGISLTASGTNINSYRWYKYADTITAGNTASIYVNKTGNYKCIASNVIGCTKSSAAVSITSQISNTLPVKTLTLQPGVSGNDSYIESSSHFNYNFGNDPFLYVTNYYQQIYYVDRSILKFNLQQIPANADIISANLKLYIDSVAGWTNINQEVCLKRVEQSWVENTVTFGNQPAVTDYQQVVIPHNSIIQKTTIQTSITDMVNYWTHNPVNNNGLMIMMKKELYNGYGWIRLASSDYSTASKRPKLIVQYTYAAIDTSDNTTFCSGDSVILSTNIGSYTYQWYKNNIAISGAISSSYTAKTTGTYAVVISNLSGCTVQSANMNVTVNTNPAATITALGNLTFCNGDSVKLQANSGTGLSYLWYKSNVALTNAQAITYTAKQAGNYKARVTNANGCTKISNTLTVTVPCRLSGNETGDNFFTITPNPSGTDFEINIVEEIEIYSLNIYDVDGRLVDSKNAVADNEKFGYNLDKGIYLLELKTNEGLMYKRIIKL